MSIPMTETRGRLSYSVGDDVRTFEGWVTRQGAHVVARKYRGRWRWMLCNVADVVRFTPHDAPATSGEGAA